VQARYYLLAPLLLLQAGASKSNVASKNGVHSNERSQHETFVRIGKALVLSRGLDA
jgi:hypothetical protein